MRYLVLCVLFFDVLGCAASMQRIAFPNEVSAIGFGTGFRSHQLARNSAQARALAEIHSLLSEEGVEITYHEASAHSGVKIERPAKKIQGLHTEYFPTTSGWMARAHASRSAQMVAKLKTLPLEEATVTVPLGEHTEAVAYLIAKSRAIRGLVAQTLGPEHAQGVYEGRLVVATLEPRFSEGEVTLRLVAHAQLKRVADLTDAQRIHVLEAGVDEHCKIGSYAEAQTVLDRLSEITGKDLRYWERRAEIFLEAQLPMQSANAYAAARQASRNLRKYAPLEIAALRAVREGDEAQEAQTRIESLRKALREIEETAAGE